MVVWLLSFSECWATKSMSLNNEPCMTRLTLIDLKPVKFHYFPFMNSLDKCDGRLNNDLAMAHLQKCMPQVKLRKV